MNESLKGSVTVTEMLQTALLNVSMCMCSLCGVIRFAMSEAGVCLVTLLRSCSFTLLVPPEDVPVAESLTVRPAKLRCLVKPRDVAKGGKGR
jgi:hypothetical protein